MSNSQLNELILGIKYDTRENLNLSRNVIGDYNNETNFLHKLSLTDMQVLRLRRVFANNSSVNIKLSKTQLSKILQLRGFLGRVLKP